MTTPRRLLCIPIIALALAVAFNALKKEAKEVSKQLEGAAKVEGKAQDAFDKQSEAAAKQAEVRRGARKI